LVVTVSSALTAALVAGPASVVTLASPLGAQAPSGRIVYVSSGKLFSGAPGWDAAEARFTVVVDSVHAAEKKLDDSMSTMLTSFGRDEAGLSPDARLARRQELDRVHTAFGKQKDLMEGGMQERRAALLDPISEKVKAVLARVRREKGYAMILDLDSGSILDASPALDITDQVIAMLKTSGPKTSASK
jgi:Skp family chaperone for outer membrane proteins